VQSVIDSLNLQAKEKGIEIELKNGNGTKNVILLGDPVRLNQILINLVNNAIKFTHKGKITIDIIYSEKIENKLNITFKVTDTGIGIPKDKINSIFDTFKQADESITRKFGGTGLGLTISKQLVELQNGKISVSSEVGIGTTFTFVIPYESGRSEDMIINDKGSDENASTKVSKSLSGMRVLLVEDNDINRMYAANVLKKWHCSFEEAENGEIALEKVRKHNFDIILMDIQMPVLDGLETARAIRNTFSSPKKDIPIVAFTANALKGDKAKYLDAGMNDYISKPFMPDDLYQIMSSYYSDSTTKNLIEDNLIDLSYLRKMSNNDESFVLEMVESFVEKTPNLLEELSSSCAEKDWTNVGNLAHKLKPNLAFMGIESLKDLVLRIETDGKSGENVKELPKLVDELIHSVNEAIEELKN